MVRDLRWRERPEVEKAYAFETGFCEDPSCGLHIIPCRENGEAICEIVMSAEQTLKLGQYIKDVLYVKVVEKDPDGQG